MSSMEQPEVFYGPPPPPPPKEGMYPMKRQGVIHEREMPLTKKRKTSSPPLKSSLKKNKSSLKKQIAFTEKLGERVISPDAKEYNKQNSQTKEERHNARLEKHYYPNNRILSPDETLDENTAENSYQGIKTRKEIAQYANLRVKYQQLLEEKAKLEQELEQQKAKLEQEENNNSGGSNKSKKNKSKSKSTKKNKIITT